MPTTHAGQNLNGGIAWGVCATDESASFVQVKLSDSEMRNCESLASRGVYSTLSKGTEVLIVRDSTDPTSGLVLSATQADPSGATADEAGLYADGLAARIVPGTPAKFQVYDVTNSAEVLSVDPTNGLSVGVGSTVRAVSATDDIDAGDGTLLFTTGSGAAQTLTAPTAVGRAGKRYRVLKVDAGTTAGQLASTGAQTFGGAASPLSLSVQYAGVEIESDGTNWQVNYVHPTAPVLASEKAAASGVATLDSGSLVVQNPTNATATPTASKIVIADGSALVDGWVSSGAAAGTPSLRALGTSSTTACAGDDKRLLAGLDGPSRTFRSVLSPYATSFLTVSGTAYFVYLGRTTAAVTPKYVEAYLNVVGVTLTVAEAGIFSTPAAPNKAANQTVTKLAAVATWDSLTSGLGVKRSAAMSTEVAAGTHLWAGFRGVYSTMPTFAGLLYDNLQGLILVTGSAAAFSTSGPWTGVLVTAQTAAAMVTCCPDLQLTID